MRRSFYINKPFQTRLAVELTLFVLVVPFLVWANIYMLGITMNNEEILAGASKGDGAVATLLVSKQWWWMLLFYIATMGLVFMLVVFHSHRIAGPAHKFAQTLKRIAAGELDQPLRLRKNDFLKEVGEAINEVIAQQGQHVMELRRLHHNLHARAVALRDADLMRQVEALGAALERYHLGVPVDGDSARGALAHEA